MERAFASPQTRAFPFSEKGVHSAQPTRSLIMPFPMRPANPPQFLPTGGNPKVRTFRPNGLDGFTGPDYRERRMAGPVIPALAPARSVKRMGVAVGNRGEWKR